MIDISTETVVTLTQATRHVPSRRQGAKTAVSTVWRWAMRGIRGVKLETLMVGGRRCTSTEALQRFYERVTAATDGTACPSSLSTRRRQQQVEAAERELEAAGI
jgi:hypothetical protein